MSFIDCINKNAVLSGPQKKALIGEFDEMYSKYKKTMGDELGASVAAQKFVDVKAAQLTKNKENLIKDVLSWKALRDKLDAKTKLIDADKELAGTFGKKLYGKSSVAMAARSILESVFIRHTALERRATTGIATALEKYRAKHAGITQDVEGFKDVARVILGGVSEDAGINADARAFRGVFESVHKQYEASGGIIGKLDNYFPQRHNPKLVGSVDEGTWVNEIKGLLDLERTVDMDTGLPMTDVELTAALSKAYSSIKTNGLDEVAVRARDGKQTIGAKGVSVSKRHSSARFLHFKDADSFFKYNEKYGFQDAGLYDAMMGHIHTMTRDTALMMEMGPNPSGQIERLKMNIQADGGKPQALNTVQGLYDVLAGRTSYSGQTGVFYNAVMATQNLLRSAYLVGAPISALSDTFYGAYTARLNGLSATNVLKNYMSYLNPASSSGRRLARRTTFIAGATSGKGLSNARFMDDMASNGVLAWAASFTNKSSGLQIMTDAIKAAVPLEAMGFMVEAKAGKVKWADLDRNMREAFGRWDMDETDYNNITKSKEWIDDETGADFIRPEDVAASGFESTAAKYDMWINDMALSASNEPRLLTRAISTGAVFGDATSGTALRGTASSLMMFKSFGVSVVMNHLLDAMRHSATSRGMSRLERIAPFLVGMAFSGLISLQVRQVVQGKTPLEINTDTMMAAMVQGGGFGIFGDFLFSDTTRFGASFTKTLLGPMASFTDDVHRLAKGNFDKMLEDGEAPNFGSDVFQFAERNFPAAKLWYVRLLVERLMLDQIERMIDPNFDTRMARIENKMNEEKGQESWWGAGEIKPEFMK